MKIKPYSNLSSHNLGLLLFLARITVYVGAFIILASLVFFLIVYSSPIYGPMAYAALIYIPFTLIIFFISGVMASIVAFEDNYRKRTEHLLNQS